ncbi:MULTISPECIES: helix-turn-helix transcriptional regulator [unclassified Streptomyces]|uniref:helix-turn-helix transcriptional regulator n=1 Tax=unclassified Streptomyces TaxID=2593676 RepID=UPI0033312DE2
MTRDRSALGGFLRSRRDRLTPAQAGIEPFPGPRRVPGLRRDELAVAAGVSPDHYSRLEQGRQANISTEVLDALARALRLDDTERAHLYDLASPTRSDPGAPHTSQHPDPGLLRLMTALDHVPVLLLGRRGEVLARNSLLTETLGSPLEPGTSFVRFMFQDPVARVRILNWPDFAAATVATMHRETARHPTDRRLPTLMDDLRTTDEDVARWWDDHSVRDYTSVSKRIQHPTAGPLTFDIEIVGAPHEPDQRLVVYTAEPDSPTARVLPILASWNTTHHRAGR